MDIMNLTLKSTKSILLPVLLMFAALTTIYAAGEIDPTFNGAASVPSGFVTDAVRQNDGKIIAVGSFAVVNSTAVNSSIVRFNADGTLDSSFMPPALSGGVSGGINTVALQSNGKIIIAGNFTMLGGAPTIPIARLNTDGSLDNSFNLPLQSGSSFTGSISDVIIQPDDKILIGGSFTYVPAVASTFRRNLARLNADGTTDDSFFPGNAFTDNILDIEIQPDGKVISVGTGSNSNTFLRRYEVDGTIDPSFNAIINSRNERVVLSIKVQPDGKILIGGNFSSVNNVPRNNIARLNSDGSLDESFTASTNANNFLTIEIGIDGKILVGGDFTVFDGAARSYLVRLNNDGSLDTAFNYTGTVSNTRTILPLPDGKIISGGGSGINRLNADGSIDNSFNVVLRAAGLVRDIALQADGKILAAGIFNPFGSPARRNIIRFNADGTLDASFNPNLGGTNGPTVNTVAVQSDGKILVGGQFVLDGQFSLGLARLNPDGSRDTSFNLIISSSSLVYDINIQPDGKILIGGFVRIPNSPRSYEYIIRLNADGSIDDSFALPLPNNVVYKIIIQPDGKILIGGAFTQVGQIPRNSIARLNANGTLDTTFNPLGGANGTVNDIGLQNDGKVIVGGFFGFVNGVGRSNLARLNADGSLDTTFNAMTNSTVLGIKIQPDGKILVGGTFTTLRGAARAGLGRLNADGTLDLSFHVSTGTDGAVYVFELQPDNKILVGGNFTRYNNVTKFSIVRLLNSNSAARAMFDFDADGRADLSVFRPSNGGWYIYNLANNTNSSFAFGQQGDVIVPADYDGDGKTDIAVYRGGSWYLNRSTLGFTGIAFGAASDIPAPADFDGDGKAELAVFRPSNGVWYFYNLTNNQFTATAFGQNGDLPVPADYDGDGKAEIAVFRPSINTWFTSPNPATNYGAVQFGQAGDKLVPADYDGDGKTDIAVFRPSNGVWYLLQSTAGFTGVLFGQNGDAPVPADYDGDGKADIAVFRRGNWYLNRSSAGFTGIAYGATTDLAVPNAFVR